MISEILSRFETAPNAEALILDDTTITFGDLSRRIDAVSKRLAEAGPKSGDVVLLYGDFTLDGIAALLSLMKHGAIVIIVAPVSREKREVFGDVGRAQWLFDAFSGEVTPLDGDGAHPLYDQLRDAQSAGIVLFSSGSSGTPKGTVHSADRLLEKFRAPGKQLRTLAFLLFDHIAGLDTLFYSLANLSVLVLPTDRSPASVCALVARHKVEVLPTAPSFLNLLLLSGATESHDLSSLKIITYGSEMMPPATLDRCADAFPQARLIQKYGTSEIGALPTQSRSNRSTWLKLGGDGYDWRVREGLFEIKARTAMIGYLNADSPFTDDGYFRTGDRVEVDGDYIRFLGRDSDIINVGGQKVFPAEVEAMMREMPEIEDVSVFGEAHPILGAAVVAKVKTTDGDIDPLALRKAVRAYLSGKVEGYKIPQKIVMTTEPLTTERFKQVRRS